LQGEQSVGWARIGLQPRCPVLFPAAGGKLFFPLSGLPAVAGQEVVLSKFSVLCEVCRITLWFQVRAVVHEYTKAVWLGWYGQLKVEVGAELVADLNWLGKQLINLVQALVTGPSIGASLKFKSSNKFLFCYLFLVKIIFIIQC
jgi:hypothetical protein